MKPGLISIIVTTYNRPDALQAVLSALLRQTDPDFEIIVADDGSGPATAEVVQRVAEAAKMPLTHVWQEDLGFRAAAVRNRGIERARGDYIIFLDGDCIAQRDFVAAHRRLAESGRVVTGSRILLNPDLTQQIIAGLPILDRGMAFWWARRVRGQVNKVLPLFLHLPDLRLRRQSDFVWRGIKSCNLAVWRSDAKAVNGFDETFTGWGHEDADFVARLFNHGILRKKGFYATEVLHLWHREATRDSESPNRARVQERLKSRQYRAERGLAEA